MFGLLFDIEKDGNVLLQDKSIALCPAIFEVYKHKRMGSDAVRWIVMVHDYKSPYRNLPIEERKKYVTKILFDKESHYILDDPLFVNAVEQYKVLQYDPILEQYMAMRDKMYEKTKIYKTKDVNEKNLSEINELEVEFEKSATALEKIKQIIIKNMESDVKFTGKEMNNLSLLEQQLAMDKK
jgi:hypothetical protein